MKRIVALIAMIAVLLSSLAFAEEMPAAEVAAIETVGEVMPAAADHVCIASCKNPAACATCGGTPTTSVLKHNTGDNERVPLPGMKGYHGYECVDCKQFFGTAACYPSCKQPGVCAVCGQESSAPIEHNSGGEWFGTFMNYPLDITKHCHLCVDCGEYYGIEDHDIPCNATGLMKNMCTVCYARVEGMQPSHVYESEEMWYVLPEDDSQHVRKCVNCGEYFGGEAHAASCANPLSCKVCNYPMKDAAVSHISDGVLKPVTGVEGMHGYLCTECGKWYDLEACSASCANPGVCTGCGQACELGSEHVSSKGLIVHPEDAGKHCKQCDGCGSYYEVAAHYIDCSSSQQGVCSGCGAKVEGLTAASHTSDGVWHSVEGQHAHKCSVCGQYYDQGAHWVACTNRSVCGECGLTVADAELDHKLTDADLNNVKIIAGDTAKHGVYCTKCGDMVFTAPHEFVSGLCACGMKLENMEELVGPAKITLGVGEIVNAGVQVLPAGAEATVTYKSSATKYATVDADGNIKGVRKGSAKITVTAVDKNGKTLEGTISVTVKSAPTKIVLSESEIDIGLGSSIQLDYEFNSSSYYSNVSWTSSDPSVAAVDANGNIVGVGAGSATITATTFNNKKDTCVVNVKPAATVIILDDPEFSLNVKKTFKITGKLTNEKGEDCMGKLSFESSNPAIATVDSKGTVTGKAKSTEVVTITVTADTGAKAEAKVRVLGEPSKFTLNVSSATLNFGETLQIIPIIGEDEHATFTYKSSSTKIAKVDAEGVVTPVKEGKVTITVTSHNKKTAKATITIVDPYKPASVAIDQGSKVFVNIGETVDLSATIAPDTAVSELTWSSKSTKIAKVDAEGVVTGVKVGSTTITVKTRNSKSDTITVEVVDPTKPYQVVLDQEGTIELNVGDSLQLNATVNPETAENKNVTWKSSKSSYVKVDENGLVTALKAYSSGATITVTTTVNKKTDTVKIKVVDKFKPDSISLNVDSTASMDVSDGSLQLGYTLSPADSKSIVSWKSSSTSVAKVDANGVVTPLKAGTVTITATTHNSKKDSVKLTITDKYAPSSISINEGSSMTIGVGEEIPLSYVIEPDTAFTTVTWKTSNKSYATVDENGVVTGVKAGRSATITVTTHNGKTDKITMNVKDLRPDDVVITGNGTLTLAKGETQALVAELLPAGSKSALTWTSSDDAIATVDKNGNVTGLKEGNVIITVTTANDKTDRVTVYVEDNSKPTGVTLSHSGTVNVNLGESLQLSAALTPAEAVSSLSWTSSNKAVATVDANGLVSAIAEGEATITVATENGLTANVTVKVVDPFKATGIKFAQTGPVEIFEGGNATLSVVLEPVNAKTTLSWVSGNEAVATVADGVVTGVKAGTTIVTVSTDTGYKASIVVIVKIKEESAGVELSGSIGTLTELEGMVGELVSDWEWSEEAKDYRVFYTIKGSDGALMVNRRSITSESAGEKIASIEIMKACNYSIYGIKYGMTADEVIDALTDLGMRFTAVDGSFLRCYPSSGFALLEIGFAADGTVNIVGGYNQNV